MRSKSVGKKAKGAIKRQARRRVTSTAGQLRWPQERHLLIRPDRYEYVRKVGRPSSCVFCLAAKEPPEFTTLCLWQNELSMIVLNKYPYNPGHLLVLPRRHCGDLLKLTDTESEDLWRTARIAFAAITEVYAPAGINMGLNHGAAAGAGLPEHLHLHLVPRWAGDVNFFPLLAETKVLVETLEQTYAKLSVYFKG